MLKYGKTPQLEDVVYNVKSNTEYHFGNSGDSGNSGGSGKSGGSGSLECNYPKIKFEGTVKVHGTNAAVVIYKDRVAFQSRTQEITIDKDNFGFATFASTIDWRSLAIELENMGIIFEDHIAFYGEWAGGNIQKGVAVTGLPTFFMIFEIVVDGKPLNITLYNNNKRIYHAKQFGVYNVEIDFANPSYARNQIVEMVNQVEEKCPVGSYFGSNGIGEGIVFRSIGHSLDLKFKAKGAKHSESKTTVITAVDTTTLVSEKEFVEEFCVENRMLKGIDYLNEINKPLDRTSTGDFIKWVVNDIITEKGYIMVDNMFNINRVKGIISNTAKEFYFNYISKQV